MKSEARLMYNLSLMSAKLMQTGFKSMKKMLRKTKTKRKGLKMALKKQKLSSSKRMSSNMWR